VAVGGILAAGYGLGLFDLLQDTERATGLLRDLGGWGYALYVLAFALLEPFFIPGILFILPAALTWPAWLALTLSLIGSVGAGVVGFGFARFLARDWVSQRIPQRLHRWDARLEERGLQTVILVRLVLFLMPPAHWALGISRVRFAPFLLGTTIGFIPGVAALTYLSRGIVDWLRDQPDGRWQAFAIAAGAVYVLYRIVRSLRGSGAQSDR
jgi:uncharacterized membrane protein YdjX (TVP38/TMEM64 family)